MLGAEGDGVDVRRFIERWRGSERSERAAAQQHFLELCEVLEVARPGDPGQPHADYDFERRVRKPDGRARFADRRSRVWRPSLALARLSEERC